MIKMKGYSRFLPTSQFILLNLILGVGHFLVLLNAGAYLPMLPYISGTIEEGIGYVVWGQSDYFTAMGAAFLFARPLMLQYGPKNVSIFAYLLFSAASLAALFRFDISFFTAIRVLQGFSAGLSILPSFFLLLEYYSEDRQKTAASLWSLAVFVPFSLGPALGGAFSYELGDWRLFFASSFIIALFVAAVLWALLADWEDNVVPSHSFSQRVWLFLLFFTAVIALQEFFDVGVLSDLSSRFDTLWWLFFGFALFAWLFWIENRRSDIPLVNTLLFACPNYGFGMLILCIAFICVQGSLVQYIIRFQLVEGYTAWHVGLLFLPIFLLSKPLSILAQNIIQKGRDPRIFACISFAAFATSFWWISETVRPAPWETYLWPQFLEGAALGLFFVSMTAVTISHVPEPEKMHAVDVLNSVRNLAAGLAITLSDIGWDRLSDYELNRINGPDASNASRFLSLSQGMGTPNLIQEKIKLQASFLAFNDIFHLLAVAFAALAALVWLARPSQKKPHPDMPIFENLGEEP
jgi:DHA2 family multidrug resistance protein